VTAACVRFGQNLDQGSAKPYKAQVERLWTTVTTKQVNLQLGEIIQQGSCYM